MPKLIDIKGETFGQWKVLKHVGRGYWECECSCGNTAVVYGTLLRKGKSLSCGHDTTGFKDLTGKKIGEWEVLKYLQRGYYLCRCSCENVKEVSGFHLRSGRSTSCGHSNTGCTSKGYNEDRVNHVLEERLTKIEVGDEIGEWIVLEKIENANWLCECSCGNILPVNDWRLKIGKSRSCGHAQIEDIKGNLYGEWTADKYVGGSYWECTCSCGRVRNVRKNDLLLGRSKSCGHIQADRRRDLCKEKFGMLTPVKFKGGGIYECICDCGSVKDIRAVNLTNGGTISCGCKHATMLTKDFMEEVMLDFEAKKGRKPFAIELAQIFDLNQGYVNVLIKKHELTNLVNRSYRSSYEIELCEYIHSLDTEILVAINDRSVLSRTELDIHLPQHQFAIEFNGDYWHREEIKGKNYHQDKTIECAKRGITLMHIFEYEWLNSTSKDIIKNIIRYYIANSTLKQIKASDCKLRLVKHTEEVIEFLDQNHLYGHQRHNKAYGLYYNDELVHVMTFKNLGEDNWELVGSCSKLGLYVENGEEKIFNHFLQENIVENVKHYCDISKFNGSTCANLGFKTTKECITEPNYVWVFNGSKSNSVLNEREAELGRLISQGFGNYGGTEEEIMTNRGYVRVYSCGKLEYTWENDLTL